MDALRWEKIKQLFEHASELSASDRHEYLKMQCGDDVELRQEVSDLLGVTNTGLEDIAQSMASSYVNQSNHQLRKENAIGQRLGPYQITGIIGEGGMGTVYKAQRADDEYQQQVAIKLIRSHLTNKNLIERFQRERQILANLNHPNIAGLVDGGTSEQGLPFIVMEYVDGLPILEYCKTNQLSISQKIELFKQIAAAIIYAHQNLVVHRDIKPENILVTQDGQVKLLDFGIAKIVSENSVFDGEVTQVDQRAMTPFYASPEQLSGQPITTSTDVYSLGVLMFQLLTGVNPYYRVEQVPASIIKAICETDPIKPSVALIDSYHSVDSQPLDSSSAENSLGENALNKNSVDEKKLRVTKSRLTGELDSIVLKAMQKKTSDRYSSVELLLEDIEAFQTNRPISAEPDSWYYRSKKFIKRNQISVAFSSLVGVLLVIFSSTLFYQNTEVKKERDRAEAVSDFLISLLEGGNTNQGLGPDVKFKEVVDIGAEQINQEFKNQPELRAYLLATIASVYYELRQNKRAEELLLASIELYEGESVDNTADLAVILNKLAGVYSAEDRLVESQEAMQRALALEINQFGKKSIQAALTRSNIAYVMSQQGLYQQAEEQLTINLTIYQNEFGQAHIETAKLQHNLAQVLRSAGKFDAAEKYGRTSLKMKQQLLGNDHPLVADGIAELALILLIKGDLKSAEEMYLETLRLDKLLSGEEHRYVSDDLNNLGITAKEAGELGKSEDYFRQCLVMREKLFKDKHHPQFATLLRGLASLLMLQERFSEAEKHIKRIQQIANKNLERDNPVRSQYDRLQGKMYRLQGDLGKAEKWLNETNIHEATLIGDEHPNRASTFSELGYLSLAKEEPISAILWFKKALKIRQNKLAKGHHHTAQSQADLGRAQLENGELKRAYENLQSAYALLHKKFGDDHFQVALVSLSLAQALEQKQQKAQAIRLIEKSYQTLHHLFGSEHSKTKQAKALLQSLSKNLKD